MTGRAGRNRRSAVGDDPVIAVYQEIRARGSADFGEVSAELGLTAEEGERHRAELLRLGLLVPAGARHAPREELDGGRPLPGDRDRVTAVLPEIALLRVLDRERGTLREHLDRADRFHEVVSALTHRFLATGGDLADPETEVEFVADYRRIQQFLNDMADFARQDIRTLSPAAPGRELPERVLDRDRRVIGRGVTVRSIYSRHAWAQPDSADLIARRREAGVEIRLSTVVPMNLVLVDDHLALVPADPDDRDAGAVLVRGPALVRSYRAFYEHCWYAAAPCPEGDAAQRGVQALTEQQHAVLRMLGAGMKDERIARALGVSLRTVSRLVAELMQELNTASRFEAGVRAARRGWLD